MSAAAPFPKSVIEPTTSGDGNDLVIADPAAYLSRFGLTDFRPGQRDVISAVLAGHDSLCIMPTGGGKSLCYQLPAVMRDGLTLVLSPLIALMKDQVDALQDLGIAATFINSSLTPDEQRSRLEQMASGKLDLVYVAPERLRNTAFLEKVRSARVHLLAVDEAHCISEWGHDFRPDYARIGRFRERLGFPQTIALTATATPKVREDVVLQLKLREPRIFITGFARENLHFEVQEPYGDAGKLATLLEFLEATPGAGIIYAATRKRCEELVEILRESIPRKVGLYHAGLLPDDRRRIQDDFMEDRVPIIVATNAFGMGIDKADLRFVVHYNMPGSLEAYYQEAGRAGRDGQPSRCLLLFSHGDRYIQEFFIDNKYPPREDVEAVYNYLRGINASPIEITLQEIKDELKLSLTSEGVGSCERILEKVGALERLDSKQNQAAVKIDSDLPTLVDLLPAEAKVQRKVLRAVENIVGELRRERVFLSPVALAKMTELDGAAVSRALKELCKLKDFDYVPPFRGRAVHMLERKKKLDQLGIDFAELGRRKQWELDKLERVIGYATSRRCRQVEILDYFGDPSKRKCGLCDSCGGLKRSVHFAGEGEAPAEPRPGRNTAQQALRPPGRESASDNTSDLASLEVAQMILSGVARTQGRFGKGVIAKMLFGSDSKSMAQFGLSRLSTFGLLSHLKCQQIEELIGSLLQMRLLRQVENEKFRPLVQLTPLGEEVMRGKADLPGPLTTDAILLARIKSGYKRVGRVGKDGETERRRDGEKERPRKEGSDRRESQEHVDEVRRDENSSRLPVDDSDSHSTLPPSIPPSLHPSVSPAPASSPHSRPNHYWTWQLFAEGKSAQECQLIRRISEETLFEHLLKAARDGLAVDPRWILKSEQWQALRAAFGDASASEIQPLLSNLPAGLRYRDVQFYLLTRDAS